MALSTKVGSFTANTSTGNQAIIGVGFQPKTLLLWSAAATSNGIRNDAPVTIGFASAPGEEFSVSTVSADGAATSNTSRRMAAKLFSKVDSGEATSAEATLVSFNADGFTINWTTAFASARIINYMALGGSDLINAKALTWNTPTTTGNKAVTGVGFQPDFVLHLFAGDISTTLPVSQANARLSFGVMTAEAQWANGYTSRDAEGSSNSARFQYTNACLASVTADLADEHRTSFVSMDADGFTTSFSVTGGTARPVISLCLKGPRFKVGSFNKTDAAAPASQAVAVGIKPAGLLLSHFNHPTLATARVDAQWGLGAASASASTKAIAIVDEDARGTTEVNAYQADQVVTLLTQSETLKSAADLTSFDADGFTLNWTTNTVDTEQILYIAMGGGRSRLYRLGVADLATGKLNWYIFSLWMSKTELR